jgi:hypothetical protein
MSKSEVWDQVHTAYSTSSGKTDAWDDVHKFYGGIATSIKLRQRGLALTGLRKIESETTARNVKRMDEVKQKEPTLTTGDLEEARAESGHSEMINSAIEKLKALPEYSTGGYMDPSSALYEIEQKLKDKRFYEEAEHIHKLGREMPDLLYKKKTKANLTKAYKPIIAYLKTIKV